MLLFRNINYAAQSSGVEWHGMDRDTPPRRCVGVSLVTPVAVLCASITS